MRKGQKQYQKDAQHERDERRARQEAGKEAKSASPMEDLAAISGAISEYTELMKGAGTLSEAPKGEAKPKGPAARQGATTAPSSVLRGFPEVDLLIASPAQKFLLVGCRTKKKCHVYPQDSQAQFAHSGKELQTKGFQSVDAAVREALGLDKDGRVEIYSAAFAPADDFLVVTERNSDTVLGFSLNAKGEMRCAWRCKLPDRRLVSLLPPWGLMGHDTLVCRVDTNAEVELIQYSGGQLTSLKQKFKIGNAASWAQVDNELAVAGSFLHEPRLTKLVPNAAHQSVAIEPVYTVADKTRALALAIVRKGSPSFNTRHYFICFNELGMGLVYDVDSLQSSNACEVVARFEDADYAGYDAANPVRLITAVAGKSYHETLLIGLIRGPRITVYRVKDVSEPKVERVTDLFNVQEGDAVYQATFVQSGLGIATCGLKDERHVRLFSLPS
ncbi:hypothetical protein STCU_08975 [Strigomonas culicis]|nr:hypothetical protein STCU_08975 [Strigomonas culicis]|eukprot:EPY20491.1 hypothetical protein STCU_08975 [Strigomonas culicis]